MSSPVAQLVKHGYGLSRQTTNRSSAMQYPFVPWERLSKLIVWRTGEHVLCVGGTGSGKTTLEAVMLRRRTRVVVFVSKGADSTLAGPLFRPYIHYATWPPKRRDERVMLWPANKATVKETRENKQEVFRHAMADILLHTGHWCEAIDELHYMADSLKLDAEITDTEEQGRSFGITVWGNTQRPASIPLACYPNALHAFMFVTQEDYDVKRLGSIRNNHTTAAELQYNLEHLVQHEFVYIDRLGHVPPCRSILDLHPSRKDSK